MENIKNKIEKWAIIFGIFLVKNKIEKWAIISGIFLIFVLSSYLCSFHMVPFFYSLFGVVYFSYFSLWEGVAKDHFLTWVILSIIACMVYVFR